MCQCAKDYRGKQCQFNVDVCSPKKIDFNGAYSCSGDNDAIRCKLSCPDGVTFSHPPAIEYICEYEKGYFTPSNVPRCNYSEYNVALSHVDFNRAKHCLANGWVKEKYNSFRSLLLVLQLFSFSSRLLQFFLISANHQVPMWK